MKKILLSAISLVLLVSYVPVRADDVGITGEHNTVTDTDMVIKETVVQEPSTSTQPTVKPISEQVSSDTVPSTLTETQEFSSSSASMTEPYDFSQTDEEEMFDLEMSPDMYEGDFEMMEEVGKPSSIN